MSNELVERLRKGKSLNVWEKYELADAIEQLQAREAKLREAINTAIVSVKVGYPEYDWKDTIEILTESIAQTEVTK